jgi:hypothetical protein
LIGKDRVGAHGNHIHVREDDGVLR